VNRLLTKNLWSEVRKLTHKLGPTRACIAYFTTPALLHWRAGDVLIVNASDGAIKGGETSARAVRELAKRGVLLYSEPYLHAKVILAGNTAVVGSANVSASSADRLLEAAILTTSPAIVGPVRAYLHQLASSAQAIDEPFLRRIEALPVSPRRPPFGGGGRRIHRPRLTKAHKTWVVVLGVSGNTSRHESALVKARQDAQQLRANRRSELDEFWWGGGRLDRAEPGDSVIRVWKNSRGEFGGEQVSLSATILLRRKFGARQYFFLEVPPSPATWVNWRAFKQALKVVGEKPLGPYSTRELSDEEAAALRTATRKT
jgi:hypothetical protein